MKNFIIICTVLSMLLSLVSCNSDTTSSETASVEVSSQDVSEVVSNEEASREDTSSTVEEESPNVALNKRVYCSSENTSMLSLSRFAVDGDSSTHWASNTATEQIEEWIMVDLGKNYSIEEIVIDWGRSYASEYTVEVSRGGIEFTEVYSTSEGGGSTTTVVAENAVARYVKINCKKVVSVLGGYAGAAIKDVSVAGSESNDQTLGSEKEAMIPTKIILPDENDIYSMGRNFKENELIWAGAVYEFKCTGSIVGAVVVSSSQFEVSIDGGDFVPYKSEEGGSVEYIFAEDLDPEKEHVVRIMKSGDIWSSRVTITGIVIEERAEIIKDYTRDYDLKIEFVGDSITSGAKTPTFSQSYVYLTADALNANFNVVSRSGQGLYKHANNGNGAALKVLYAGIGMEDGKYKYDYNPDLVVLNIGTNDGANVRTTENEKDKNTYRETFKNMYVEMLEIIHEKNPNATILCTGGMMGDISNVKPQIEEAVSLFKAENPDAKVYLEYLSASKDISADTSWHPGAEGHAQGAGELIPIIKRIMNIN